MLSLKILDERLASLYGKPEWRPGRDPVETLVRGILSQNTSDTNSGRAYEALRRRYGSWIQVLDAPESELVQCIRSGGLALQKAPRIKSALSWIKGEGGEFNLDWLAGLPVHEARSRLTSLKGIGDKTASIVLLFAFNMPAFPVDTHVGRVARRLGLAAPSATASAIMEMVEAEAEGQDFFALHLNLVRHGRETCSSRAPACRCCGISDICPSFSLGRK